LSWQDTWDPNTSYRVLRLSGGSWTAITGYLGPFARSFSNTGLTSGTSYSYKIEVEWCPESCSTGYSNVASATTQSAPAAPASLGAASVSGTQIDLSWTDHSGNESGFKIERKTGSGGTYSQVGTVAANVTSYSSVGLVNGTTYYHRVRPITALVIPPIRLKRRRPHFLRHQLRAASALQQPRDRR
jgi:uncharacterized protein